MQMIIAPICGRCRDGRAAYNPRAFRTRVRPPPPGTAGGTRPLLSFSPPIPMLDINLLRKDLPGVVARLQARKSPQPFLDVARFEALEAERKAVQTRTEELQARRNPLSKQIGQARGSSEDTSAVMAEVQGIGDELKASAERLDAIQAELHAMLMALPNLPQPERAGRCRRERQRRGAALGRAARLRLRAARPCRPRRAARPRLRHRREAVGLALLFLRGPAARLHRALAPFMLDLQTVEHGYTECHTPYIVNREVLEGTGQLPKFSDDMFRVLRGGAEEARRRRSTSSRRRRSR